MQQVLAFVGRFIFAWLVAFPFLWANDVLGISATWSAVLWLGVVLTAIPDTLYRRLPRLSPLLWRVILTGVIVGISLLGQTAVLRFHPTFTIAYLITWLLLLGLNLLFSQSDAVAKLGMIAFGLLFALLIANLGAGIVLAQLEQATVPTPPSPTSTPSTTNNSQITIDHSPTPTPTPSTTDNSQITIDNSQITIDNSPTPTRPIAGFGYLEWLEDSGEADWTHLTAYGPRVNSVAHASMYDAEGNIVYDTIIEYNGKGYRGPEVAYEKPEDVYRILIIGDSFVEAIQVPYKQTFQAQLQARLSQHDTPERRYEVVAMGRTGWGTMHEATYYQVEGHKYNADLVILMFYINDVADNLPRVFYPNINNTNYDFVIDEGQVQIVDTNERPLPPNNGRLLYNALHWRLRETKLAKLFIRLADPPIPIVTPGGVMSRVHPQFYIYVTEPEVEGYAEGWQRTADLLTILAQDVQADGAQLAIVPIFLGSEMVNNVSGWFPELTDGWQWDDSLPDTRLAEILDNTSAYLWPTRPTFTAYADGMEGQVYNLFYLPEDGHFNVLGHQVTYEAIYDWLVMEEFVVEP